MTRAARTFISVLRDKALFTCEAKASYARAGPWLRQLKSVSEGSDYRAENARKAP